MDPSLYIPVVCDTDSKYSGKCYQEKISAVQMLNGCPVSKDKNLSKEDFKTGDEVIIRFQNKDFHGIVDFSDGTHLEREAPHASPFRSSRSQTNDPPDSLEGQRVRKRHRSWDSPAYARKKKMNNRKRPPGIFLQFSFGM